MKFNRIQSGERLSFFSLFEEKKYRIHIPIIQRDYAQGRKNATEICNSFLDALYNYLDENKPYRDLDFVYGSVQEAESSQTFIPLDGQQRLTTLFLLHWYLSQISDDTSGKERFREIMFQDGTSMFSYETRRSSAEFCDALMRNELEIRSLNDDTELSEEIKEQAWFYLSWRYDPTIQSMLGMLDAIHKRFKHSPHFFSRLLNTETPIITFLFLNLEDFKLSEDLYIKMNARGKILTPFENFKARYEQFLDEIFPIDSSLKLRTVSESPNVSVREYFSKQIDTQWADLFWQYREINNKSKDRDHRNTYDDELMNFIRVIFTAQYGVLCNKKEGITEENFNTLESKDNFFQFSKYEKIGALNLESATYLLQVLDALSTKGKEIPTYMGDYSFFYNEEEMWYMTLRNHFENKTHRIYVHAYFRYLTTYPNDLEGIKQWMRVIHNLSHFDNSRIGTNSSLIAALQSVEELLPNANNILEFLKTPSITIQRFASEQVKEEIIKAHLITKDEKWKNFIEKSEQHPYLCGQIGFIFEFSGIWSYYDMHQHCNWTDTEDMVFKEKFDYYSSLIFSIFLTRYEDRNPSPDYLFERAVLTKGVYCTTATSHRMNLLSTNIVWHNNIKRDHSWKRLLRVTADPEYRKKRLYIKKLLDDQRIDKTNIDKSLKTICDDRCNDWRDLFLDCPSMFSVCEQGFIRYDNGKVLLYKASQQNHIHRELYTYYLWVKYDLENNKQLSRLFSGGHSYIKVMSQSEVAHILLKDFRYRSSYDIKITYELNEYSECYYSIIVEKGKGSNRGLDYFDDLIRTLLEKLGYRWSDDNESFQLQILYEKNTSPLQTTQTTYNALLDLCAKLEELL